MAAPNSPVDVCRLALDLLKQNSIITSITNPTTTDEVICARWYDATRRALLRKHFWVFARTRKSISRDAAAPPFGYADAYNFPPEYLRLQFIGDDTLNNYKRRYEINGRQLLLNNGGATSQNIGYIQDITNVSAFDALFVILLAAELATSMAYAFTGKDTVIKRVALLLEELRAEAKSVNGQDRPPKRIESSKFRNARKNLYSNSAGLYTIFDS